MASGCEGDRAKRCEDRNVTRDVDVEGASEAIRTLLWHDSGGFESIDADNDGSITREEFTDVMAKRAASTVTLLATFFT